MIRVCDVYQTMCRLAPLELELSFDNAGFLVGRADAVCERALLALDLTDTVLDEALREGASLIITHHPVIFDPLRNVTDETPTGRRLLRLIENRMAVISMHTNLDIVEGGVNDVLLDLCGARREGVLDENGCGRFGRLPEQLSLSAFLARLRDKLPCHGLRYYDAGRPVERLAVLGGAGVNSLPRAVSLGCDTFLTADIKYHKFQLAAELGVNLIDGDHFGTENPVLYALLPKLQAAHPTVDFMISRVLGPLIRFF